MTKFIIEGGKRLKGRIKIGGNKNSILPCLAATLLTDQEVVIRNVPEISDVDISLQILMGLGAEVSRDGDSVKVCCRQFTRNPEIPEELSSKLRASVLFIGPVLSRKGNIQFYHPGGDVIGRRSIDTHLDGFRKLGFDFQRRDIHYKGFRSRLKKFQREIYLEEASVTATENMVMGSVLGQHTVTLKNCAEEPHVVDLCKLLNVMGASIDGVGTSTLRITGVDKLHGADFTISGDYMEFGTYALAAIVTKGDIEIENSNLPDLSPIVVPLSKMGIRFEDNEEFIKVYAKDLKPIPLLRVNLWPGFPTDLMSVAIVLATQARGVSLLHDWMYESRMFFVDKLIAMGSNIVITDPHRVIVWGPSKLYARNLESPDIRAGMAMVLAALIAEGKSVINKAELIERGYENVVDKLTSLGASIERVDS